MKKRGWKFIPVLEQVLLWVSGVKFEEQTDIALGETCMGAIPKSMMAKNQVDLPRERRPFCSSFDFFLRFASAPNKCKLRVL